jgi:hypothetical protein
MNPDYPGPIHPNPETTRSLLLQTHQLHGLHLTHVAAGQSSNFYTPHNGAYSFVSLLDDAKRKKKKRKREDDSDLEHGACDQTLVSPWPQPQQMHVLENLRPRPVTLLPLFLRHLRFRNLLLKRLNRIPK